MIVRFVVVLVAAALKIHCSLACKQLLDRLGGYILEERGLIKIKGKGEMLTYWLVGEKAGTHRLRARSSQSGQQQHRRPKSSLRITHRKLAGEIACNQLAASLDSPKKLRFASDTPSADEARVQLINETGSGFAGSKRNSCPNLKVGAGACLPSSGSLGIITLQQPSFGRSSVERKLCYQPHRLSTTSLVEALTFSSNAKSLAVNGRQQPGNASPSRKRCENPKIELSPPDETPQDNWPLLENRCLNGVDNETSV